jgi:NodT family efflux transporter outer membrane factor (OMF) lipoprotein
MKIINLKRNILFLLVLLAVIFLNTATNTQAKELKATVEDQKMQYINKDWWDKFQDPILKGYILKAANSNYDLKISTLKVQETQELVRETFGKEFPIFNINGDLSRQKTSNNISMGSFSLPAYRQSNYLFPMVVNYELDLWQKNRDRTKSAKKELDAVKQDEKASYISLCSTIAGVYFNVISLDKQIEFQEDILNLRKNIYELTKQNNQYGLTSTTEVILTDTAYTEAQSSLNDLKKSQSILLNQLAVLMGDSSANSSEIKRSSIDTVNILDDIPQSIKSDVVKNRPDILKAEALLEKMKIDVRLARKEILPSINLAGQFGYNANELSKVFKSDSYITMIGAGFAQNIFSGGQRRARLKAAKYRYQEMMESYQKTVLQSFQEVNDSLASLKYDTQKNEDHIKRISLEKDNLSVINNRYNYGAISYLELLQYKERIFTLQKEQLQTKTDCLIDQLSLYKASGGNIQ